MDTEKHIEIQKKIRDGLSPSDEGPYAHHAFWESYKGSVKGKLFGIVIGALVGAVIGGIVLGVASIPALGLGAMLAEGGALATIGAFSVGGLLYGMKEFSDIGRGVSNNAAQHYLQDQRTKTMVKGQIAEVKEELNEIKSMIKGEAPKSDPQNVAAMEAAVGQETNYRKSHYAKLATPKMNTFAFWKVALIGLAVGAAAGALLGATGVATYLMAEALHIKLASDVAIIGSTIIFGAMGASFGFNRDFFRKVADKTDLWFKGIIGAEQHARVREHQVEAGKAVEKKNGIHKEPVMATAVIPDYEGGVNYPTSETHFRDKVLPAAERALLSFDHTRATPQ